jgi:hypothetical protein
MWVISVFVSVSPTHIVRRGGRERQVPTLNSKASRGIWTSFTEMRSCGAMHLRPGCRMGVYTRREVSSVSSSGKCDHSLDQPGIGGERVCVYA